MVRNFGQLCDRFASLDVKLTQCSETVARRLARGEAVSMIVDSTGLRFGRASQWHAAKCGARAAHPPWRKMHLRIDADMNIHAMRITTDDMSDSEGLDNLLSEGLPLERVIADGAYHSTVRNEAFVQAGVTPVIYGSSRAAFPRGSVAIPYKNCLNAEPANRHVFRDDKSP